MLRSQAGRCAGEHLTLLPIRKELKWDNAKLRVLLLRRLRLFLDLDYKLCRCGQPLDTLGDHRAACSTVGVLQTRAVPLKRIWGRVVREAGARTRTHAFLRNLNLHSVGVLDDRRVEVVGSGLQAYSGAQVAVDATLVSPLTGKGEARPRAHWQNGAALLDAQKDKLKKYPEFAATNRCCLVTAGMEVGGRWSEEAYELLLELAKGKAEEAPKLLRGSATRGWLKRWVSLLSKTGMDSVAHTLLYGNTSDTELWTSNVPTLGLILCNGHEEPAPSRMGPR